MTITARVITIYSTGFSTGSGTVGGYMSGAWADDVVPMKMNNNHPIILSFIS
jgi:hypothetical protein